MTPAVIFGSEALAGNAVNGMYSSLQSSNVLSGIPDTMSEWQSDNVEFVGSFPTFNEIYTYETLSDNTSILGVYNAFYFSINQANMIIANVPLVPQASFTQARKNNLIGQARFVRALLYFKLSHLFGKQLKQDPSGNSLSVPLVTEPFSGVVKTPARATLKAVYDLVESDLLFASTVITNTRSNKATAAAASALLARLYLYQERWSEAANRATTVINTSGLAMATNYAFYNNTSSEHIFQLSNVAADPGFAESFSRLYSPTAFGGRGDTPFSDNLRNAFLQEPGDLRFAVARMGIDAKNRNVLFTSKYPNGQANTDDPNILRISEMFLIRAEANLRGGLTAGGVTPVQDFNRTRVRAGLAPLTSITLTNILDERRKEFCFEGLRRMDLLRNNLPLRSAGMPSVALSQPNADKVVFPIPQRELDNNSNLVQNSGY